jgi:hypothetical protein
MLCQYQEIQGNTGAIARRLRCIHCGHVTEPTEFPVETFQASVTRICPSPTERIAFPLPSMAERIVRYAAHLLHVPDAASERVILKRFTECSACPQYNDVLGACSVCGCYINLLKMGEGLNKLNDTKEECALPENQKRWKKES